MDNVKEPLSWDMDSEVMVLDVPGEVVRRIRDGQIGFAVWVPLQTTFVSDGKKVKLRVELPRGFAESLRGHTWHFGTLPAILTSTPGVDDSRTTGGDGTKTITI